MSEKKRGRPKGSKNKPPEEKAKNKSKEKKIDIRKGRPFIWTEDKRRELGESLVEFCKKDHVFHIVQWLREQNKTSKWWLKLKQSYPDLVTYHELAKEILGGKIVQLAFENGNNWAIQTFLPKYLGDLKKHQDQILDEELDRKKKLEEFKAQLGIKSHDDAKAKIDNFDMQAELMKQIVDLKAELERLKR